jgi:hypothetical protein
VGNSVQRTKRAVAQAERQRGALELRKQGFTYEAIARALEISVSGAHKLVREAIKAIPAEAANDVRSLELARLDRMMEGLWEQAKKGEPRAVAAVVRLMERRAAYLGLDRQALVPDGRAAPARIVIALEEPPAAPGAPGPAAGPASGS